MIKICIRVIYNYVSYFLSYVVLTNCIRGVFSGARFYLANEVSNKEQELSGTLSKILGIGALFMEKSLNYDLFVYYNGKRA